MTADRPYRCSVCRQSFRSQTRLKDHYREHQRPRQCQNCGKLLRENEFHRC